MYKYHTYFTGIYITGRAVKNLIFLIKRDRLHFERVVRDGVKNCTFFFENLTLGKSHKIAGGKIFIVKRPKSLNFSPLISKIISLFLWRGMVGVSGPQVNGLGNTRNSRLSRQ